MTVLYEKRGAGFHIVSEANGNRSREEVILKLGEDLETGTVLGLITAEDKYVQVDPAAADGSEVAAAVLWDRTDATDEDTDVTIHIRDCELLKDELVYPTGASQPEIDQIDAELLALEIILRSV